MGLAQGGGINGGTTRPQQPMPRTKMADDGPGSRPGRFVFAAGQN